MKLTGLSVHCYHDSLIDYCYDYDGRVEYIKSFKLKHEQEIRLRLFKILTKEAIDDLPNEMGKARQKWDKARQKWDKALERWSVKSKSAWHKKWCGCKEWNGKEIVFS